ncbi:MAG TPA: DinB family protein [Vicinamibacterales bacterium]|jgi:hypothetical protein|nr:DinB family protein [Vicinamibacterales bacterium]
MPTNPYLADLANREPLAAMRDSAARIRALTSGWSPAQYERSYAPGKWSARQIVTHLAQTEIALGNRARMALATPGYVAQAFDQDAWIDQESATSGADALDAFLALVAMNGALFGSLSSQDRETPLTHPEYGALTVDWIIHQMAGHQIHHLQQLEQIAKT